MNALIGPFLIARMKSGSIWIFTEPPVGAGNNLIKLRTNAAAIKTPISAISLVENLMSSLAKDKTSKDKTK